MSRLMLVWLGLSLLTATGAGAAEEARALVEAAYRKTQNASSVESLTEVVRLCREAQAGELSRELEDYVTRLLSWAYNRRGETYAEQAASTLGSVEQEQAAKQHAAELDAKALADFEKAIESDPTGWKPIHNRGVSYALIGKYEKAIADFDRVIKLKPDYANAWFNRGELRYELGQLETAIEDYAKAIRLDPDDFGAVTGHGHACFRLRRFREALQHYSRAIELDPNSAEAHTNRGDAYQSLGIWEQAAADFRRASNLDSKSARTYQKAAWLMATCPEGRFRRVELAVQAAEHALELAEGDDATCLDTLAAAYANASRFEEAVSTLTKAMEATRDEETRDALEGRLDLYRAGKPYRQEARQAAVSLQTDQAP